MRKSHLAAAALAALTAAGVLAVQLPRAPAPAPALRVPATVRLEPLPFEHRLAGEWTRGGRPVDAPRGMVEIGAPVEIMTHPVSVADYMDCVAARACDAPGGPATQGDLPVTGVNYLDAMAYAAWLSRETGAAWRLPTDTEWAQAAGSRYVDDALGIADDPNNPATRWLAQYAAETARARARDTALRPVGSVNVNELGVHDIAGPVWEWTSTCHARIETDALGLVTATSETCGIYIVQGQHRAALTLFERDPKTGGCSVGTPPDHLGFRLVREVQPSLRQRMGAWLGA